MQNSNFFELISAGEFNTATHANMVPPLGLAEVVDEVALAGGAK